MAGVKGQSGGANRKSMTEHRLTGTVNAAKHGYLPEQIPHDGSIPQPLLLSDDALAIWNVIVPPRVRLGWYTAADAVGVGRWCELTVTLRKIEDKLREKLRLDQLENVVRLQMAYGTLSREWRSVGRAYGLDLIGREALNVASAPGTGGILEGAPPEYVPGA